MSTVVWFNGPSADHLLVTLPPQDLEIGCNYIQFARPIHMVCAFDVAVVKRIKRDPSIEYYTRPDAQHTGWNILNDMQLNGTNSGLMAVYLAMQKSMEPIYILGCDWGLTDRSVQDPMYGKSYTTRKYTNSIKRKLSTLTQSRRCYVVNDCVPDVDVPVITTTDFLAITTK